MESSKFAAILPIIAGSLANKIIAETDVSEDEAFISLYNSELYASLENEETKVWTYSIPKLFDLYNTEITMGAPEFPDC